MYTNNAYLNHSTMDRKDKSKPLVVTMCGTYKLYTHPKLPTWRPRGRLDFQLIYIAAGKAHFHFGRNSEDETIVHAGHMILYRPKEPQKYEYYAEDQTEVYWVHFTGSDVTNILRSYGLTDDKRVFYCGSGPSYQNLFRTMINELQMCKCSRSKFLTKLLKTFDKTFREIFPVFISTKRREKPSAFFDNNFVNNAYFSEAASSSPSHLASSSSKAPISSRMTCLCLWSS